MPSSRGSSQSRDQTQVFHIAGRFFTTWATEEAYSSYKTKQLCPLVFTQMCWKLLYLHKTWTQIFMVASFIIVKTWKQPRYLSIGEWMNKLWYIQDTGIFFSAKEMSYQGTYAHPWLIHVDVWQKTTKFCKAIILQSKNKFLKILPNRI